MIDSIIKFLGGYTQEEYNKMRSQRNIAIDSFENGFPEPENEDIEVNDYVWYFCYEETTKRLKYKKATVCKIITEQHTLEHSQTYYSIRFIEPFMTGGIKHGLTNSEISKTAVGMRTKILNSKLFNIDTLSIEDSEKEE